MASAKTASVADQQAAEWFSRRLAPGCAADEQRDFQSWLAQDPRHRIAYLKTERMWARLGQAVQQPEVHRMPEAALPPQSPLAYSSRRMRRPLRIAAALAASVLLILGGWQLYERNSALLFEQSYHTAIGETRTVALADGSAVALDTDSSIVVHYDEHERSITLEQGTAFFDVTPNKNRPFVVSTALGRSTVLGTRFEIHSSADELRVLLVDGSLRLDVPDAVGQQSASVILKPGQMATRSIRESSWNTSTGDVETITAWRRGRLIFRDTPLAQALSEVNRYSASAKLRIGDAALRDLKVSGVFRTGDIDSFQLALEYTLPLRAQANGNDRVLLHRELAPASKQ